MALYSEGRGIAAEAEPFGLLTEGAAGIAAIVLAIIALAGISAGALAAIVTIVIGVGLVVQAFNAAAEMSRATSVGGSIGTTVATAPGQSGDLGGEVMVDVAAGITGIVLGILGLVGVNAPHLIPAALIVFGGSLILSGAVSAQGRTSSATVVSASGMQQGQVVYQSSAAASGFEILVGFAAVILGILTLVLQMNWVLVLAGFIAIGACLLLVSASFSGAAVRLFNTAAAD
jgi:hypothetical protein